ncbi:MAG: ABC transporter substrate-binding protein [Chloroflexi bacterium]|nr:ABC transporter substrate-binding protein [Chloroflexota bacterium]
MKRKGIWLLLSCLVVLSLLLASCAPAAPPAPTTPVKPTTPTTPTAPTAPTVPTTPTVSGAEMVKVQLTKKDGTKIEKLMEKPKYGGVYTLIPANPPRDFDPAYQEPSSLNTMVQTHNVLTTLEWSRGPSGTGEYSGDYSLHPMTFKTGMLAESWDVPDDTTIIYHIRKGVHFSLDPKNEASRLVNGREMTAEDVAFSISRNYSDIPKAVHRVRSLPEEWPVSVTTPDKWTVVVKSKPGKLDVVIANTSAWMIVIPPETVKKYGDLSDWKNSVGTGAFIIVDHVPNASVYFVRNPNYFQKDPFFPENQLPYLDGVKYLFITDTSTRIAGLRTAKIDGLYSRLMIGHNDMESLKKTNPQMNFKRVLKSDVEALHFVVNNPQLPWYDVRVRRALAMAIDREAIVRDYYQGDAIIHGAPVTPSSDFIAMYTPIEQFPSSVKEVYTYNPEKAKQLLAEAGYPKGFKITVTTSTEWDVDLLTLVKFYWAKVGVDLEIDIKERGVLTSMQANKSIKLAAWARTTGHSPYSFERYANPEAAASIGQIQDAHNDEVRDFINNNYVLNEQKVWPLLKEFYMYSLDKSWIIHMPAPYEYIPWQPWVKGYSGESVTGRSEYMGQTRYLWIDQALKKSMGF